MNLVIGASGLVGGEVCAQLAQEGKPVRALVRSTTDPAKAARLQGLCAGLATGDLKEVSSIEAACEGVTTVISTASSTLSRQAGDSIETVDAQGQLNLVRAAKTAGARNFIFVSFPPAPVDFALQRAKRAVEKELAACGLSYTVLQPTFFTEVWLSPAVGFDAANAKATIYGSGENRIHWISFVDVARFTAAAVGNPAARNATIRLGGPEGLSPIEVIRIFEEVSGRAFSVTHVPEDALRGQAAGATDSLQEAFASLMLAYAQGDVVDMAPVREIFPRAAFRLASVRDFARGCLAASAQR
jgi:uncharacterized protein YbjT (DUF2867 family)